MIDYMHLKYKKYHYLEGDETKIENYAEAASDESQVWVCHHRRELVPDRKTVEDLKSMGLYWNQPPEALIFMTARDHSCLHGSGANNPMARKSSWVNHTPEERADRAARYSASMRGKNAGKRQWHRFVNGVMQRAFTREDLSKDGWLPGIRPTRRSKMK